MPLVFTDQQLADISLEYATYNETKQSLLDSKAQTLASSASQYEIDQTNKQWTDFYRDNVIAVYHQELPLLDEDLRSLYPGEATIDEAAKRGETHFPATPPNVWQNLQPKQLDSQNGNPRSVNVGTNEPDILLEIEEAVSFLTAGFSDGANTTNSTSLYTIGDTTLDIDDVTGFSNGQRILVVNATDGLLAIITNVAQDPGFCDNPSYTNELDCTNNGGSWTQPLSGTLTITILTAPLVNLTAPCTVTNFSASFNNEEREESAGLSAERDSALQVFKRRLDNKTQTWETFLISTYKPVLEANEDQKRKSQIQTQITNLDTKVIEIDDWQTFPSTNPTGVGTESRFGDIKIADLSGYVNVRQTQNSARILEIDSALGSSSQNLDGEYSGTGAYYDFSDWLNKRVHGATGSLTAYYGFGIAIEVVEQRIQNLDSNRAEQDTVFRIEAFSEDYINNNTIIVNSSTGFEIGDTIKIFAEEQLVVEANITNITSNSIIIDQSLNTNYSVANIARILKQI